MSDVVVYRTDELRARADRLWSELQTYSEPESWFERQLESWYFSGWCDDWRVWDILDELGTLDFLAGGLW